jgi:4-hydroxybenzoate polyprenyltransferase
MFSFLTLLRPLNLVILVLTQLIIYQFLVCPFVASEVDFLSISLLSLSTILIAASGYIINDYYDQEIDAINKPQKVIIGKKITVKTALICYFVFNGVAVFVGFWLSFLIGIIELTTILSLFLYAYKFKKLAFIGNFLVAILSALSLVLVGIYFHYWNETLTQFVIFAFFISLIREIIKDIEDVEGDKKMNCKTLLIVLGERKTKNILTFIIILFVLAMFFVLFIAKQTQTWAFWHFALLVIVGQTFFLLYRIHIAKTKKDYSFLSSFCKIIMLCGILLIPFIN